MDNPEKQARQDKHNTEN